MVQFAPLAKPSQGFIPQPLHQSGLEGWGKAGMELVEGGWEGKREGGIIFQKHLALY